jgi:hypothetical protein
MVAESTMQTFDEMHGRLNRTGHPCGYWGERGSWLVAAGQHRDSDSIERSNFAAMLKRLGGESDTVAVERESHWAVGWVEHLLIDPGDTAKVEAAQEMRESIADYPLLDESHHSELEYTEFWDWAESELSRFGDGWADALHAAIESENTFIGDESSEWKAIEAARKALDPDDE